MNLSTKPYPIPSLDPYRCDLHHRPRFTTFSGDQNLGTILSSHSPILEWAPSTDITMPPFRSILPSGTRDRGNRNSAGRPRFLRRWPLRTTNRRRRPQYGTSGRIASIAERAATSTRSSSLLKKSFGGVRRRECHRHIRGRSRLGESRHPVARPSRGRAPPPSRRCHRRRTRRHRLCRHHGWSR